MRLAFESYWVIDVCLINRTLYASLPDLEPVCLTTEILHADEDPRAMVGQSEANVSLFEIGALLDEWDAGISTLMFISADIPTGTSI